jgi:phage FluMu gp28-like protein
MATDLLAAFEENSITLEVELDSDAREDLRKPEKITSPGGRVSIAAVRDGAGHADHFWALALAVRAATQVFQNYCPVPIPAGGKLARILREKRDRSCTPI